MLLFPNAKINVGLDVLCRRADGFHELATVMVPVVGLRDILEITKIATVEFVETGPAATGCPAEENLCVRAYRLMWERYKIGAARIHLHKIIPSGAGLGGGSADAAFTLRGLNEVFELHLEAKELEKLAAELGSDVPFFIQNRTQLATGRGEILTPLADLADMATATAATATAAADPLGLAGKHLVLVLPPIHVSTGEAYAGVAPHQPQEPLLKRIAENTAGNAFERHIFERHPMLKRIKSALTAHGARYASMSGSGSAVYGIFETRPREFCFSEKKCVTLYLQL